MVAKRFVPHDLIDMREELRPLHGLKTSCRQEAKADNNLNDRDHARAHVQKAGNEE